MIYLVRHGQTAFNREGRIQGQMESQLTPLGERQARAMADLLAKLVGDPGLWRLVSSPLGRARATATAIGHRLGLEMEIDARLTEIGCGAWEGRLREEIAAVHPERFADREWFFGAPGGETYEDVLARVRGWLADHAQEDARRLIVVSHGVAGRLLRGAYAGLSRHDTLWQDVPQDAVFRLAGGSIERIDCEPAA